MNNSPSIGEYLIQRLLHHGVGHVFGIPGDYVLGFYELLNQSDLALINTSDEQGAGFAADAYARLRGLGVICVTYCVGGLKVANPVAGAFAERSPVVVISGSPGVREQVKDPLLHHKVRTFDTQRKVFEQITVASAVLDNPDTAYQEIDRVLHAAFRHKRPVYLELPRDCVHLRGPANYQPAGFKNVSNEDALREAVAEAAALLNNAKHPVILADIELHRFNLQRPAMEFIRKTNIPFASTILGKSVLDEQHPLYLGVYEGAMGRDDTRQIVEESDCLLLLGNIFTDINLGIFTAELNLDNVISATAERITIRRHHYEEVTFEDFLLGLLNADIRPFPFNPPVIHNHVTPFEPNCDAPVTIARLFQQIDSFLADDTLVISDVGDALFGAADLHIHKRTEFLGPAYYASMGFSVPAAIGAQLANPKRRPLVIVGDGAFQMTGIELSTALRYHLNPIVVLLNNGGYGTERHMQDGPYNDLHPWRYSKLPELLGGGKAWEVHTEGELAQALTEARENTGTFSLVEVHLAPLDRSPALDRLAKRIQKRLAGQ